MEKPSIISRVRLTALLGTLLGLLGAQFLFPTCGGLAQTNKPSSQADLTAAGVCARCHIHIVVAWGISAHPRAGVACVVCHGESKGHVHDERNNVKPDRIPRGEAIAALCQSCHQQGFPRSARKDDCQSCHHVHALIDISKKPAAAGAQTKEKEDEAWSNSQRYREAMAAGEALVQQAQWQAALKQFEAARQLSPEDPRPPRRIALCRRRLKPEIDGFRIAGRDVDPESGLPAHVEVPELGLQMVLVPGGDLDIGDSTFLDSRLVHTVHVVPFYLGEYEVAQEQWVKIMGSNPSSHQSGFPDHLQMPVENVSWQDCQEFIKRLNERVQGEGFRLPTEAEWEYAARRGGAKMPLEEVARYRDNSRIDAGGKGDPAEFAPARVGSKRPSNLGLYDMQGNVWEWCSSLFRPYPYDGADGREDTHRDGLRVLRGGGYMDGSELMAVGLRHAERPARRFRWNGLRLARTAPGN